MKKSKSFLFEGNVNSSGNFSGSLIISKSQLSNAGILIEAITIAYSGGIDMSSNVTEIQTTRTQFFIDAVNTQIRGFAVQSENFQKPFFHIPYYEEIKKEIGFDFIAISPNVNKEILVNVVIHYSELGTMFAKR